MLGMANINQDYHPGSQGVQGLQGAQVFGCAHTIRNPRVRAQPKTHKTSPVQPHPIVTQQYIP